MKTESKKCLIAYYSRRGYNYVNGAIKNLTVGNTELVANKIKERVDGDLFKIDTIIPYPADYMETTRVAKAELHANARPALTNLANNMEQYEVVFLGYPNWWGTFPMAVFTFLESSSFNGKTIIPFCTHERSGLGISEKDIKRLCPAAKVLKGVAIKGSDVANSDKIIDSWIEAIRKEALL